MEPLRIGVLGAARISDQAIIEPARNTGHRLVAVAARDRSRAEQFAQDGNIERVLDSYREVIDDPEVDAVENGGRAERLNGFLSLVYLTFV